MSRASAWQRAKRWPTWVLLGAIVVALLAVGAARDDGPSTTEERVEEITRRLACPECDGESVFESRSRASVAIRDEVRAQVLAGTRTDDEIITFVAQAFTARVLLVPRASGIDALVWAVPVAAFVCAVAGLAFAFRRWKRAADTVPSADDRELVDAALRAGLDEP